MDRTRQVGDDRDMRLILIRHGQTPSNVRGLLDTAEPGAGLTELGRQQAEAVPTVMAPEDIDAIYASSLLRTQQTAQPLAEARGLDIVVRSGIREVIAGELEMRGDEEAGELYVGTIFSWGGDLNARIPGGEAGREAFDRYDTVVAEAYRSGARSAVMFSHGAIMRAWTAARAHNITSEFAATRPVSNTGVIILDGEPGQGWQALAWEEHALGGQPLGDWQHAGAASHATNSAHNGTD